MGKQGKVRMRHRPRVKAAVQVSGPMRCVPHNTVGCQCGREAILAVLSTPARPMDSQTRTGYVPEGRPDRRREH